MTPASYRWRPLTASWAQPSTLGLTCDHVSEPSAKSARRRVLSTWTGSEDGGTKIKPCPGPSDVKSDQDATGHQREQTSGSEDVSRSITTGDACQAKKITMSGQQHARRDDPVQPQLTEQHPGQCRERRTIHQEKLGASDPLTSTAQVPGDASRRWCLRLSGSIEFLQVWDVPEH